MSNKDYRDMYFSLLKRCKESNGKASAVKWIEERVKERRKHKSQQDEYVKEIKELRTKVRNLQHESQSKTCAVTTLQKAFVTTNHVGSRLNNSKISCMR